MHETAEDLKELQLLLNRSYERAGRHLREVMTPDRRVSAAGLLGLLAGVQVLTLATVTTDGRPLTGAADGLFYRARFWFGSSSDSTRMRHLAARPFVSATHTRGESLAVTVHGRATTVDLADPLHAGLRAYCLETYGREWDEWARRRCTPQYRTGQNVVFRVHTEPTVLRAPPPDRVGETAGRESVELAT